MSIENDIRERSRQRKLIEHEFQTALKQLLHTPGWEAFEKSLTLDLEEIVESLASSNEPFDAVRFKQGRIYQIRSILQIKKDLLSSVT